MNNSIAFKFEIKMAIQHYPLSKAREVMTADFIFYRNSIIKCLLFLDNKSIIIIELFNFEEYFQPTNPSADFSIN